MRVRRIEPGASVGAQRNEVVVCIPVYGAHEQFVSCLRSVLAHTPPEVPILICDDASPDARSQPFVLELDDQSDTGHRLFYVGREQNVGFPANVNDAFASAAPADVVVLNSDCAVAAGWLEGLRDAAYVDSRVATATAMSNNGSVVSVPEGKPSPELPEGWGLDEAAAEIRRRSLHIRPRLPTAIGHCMYIRRSALELVGGFDTAFSPGYGEEVDFSQRCRRSGLSHVLADDVFVFHSGGGSFTENGSRNPVQDEHERVLATRYPYYHEEIRLLENEVSGPLPRALGVARRTLKGLSVVIDARVLEGPMTGTQLHVLELISALARMRRVRVAVVVPKRIRRDAARALQAMRGVELITRAEARQRPRADLAHRPYQVNSAEDLRFLGTLAERLIVTNQDLIGYHNPSYFKDLQDWENYRYITRSALAAADRVVFFSSHARNDALAEDLVEPQRATVLHIGVDHRVATTAATLSEPRAATRLPDGGEAILCIGTDFRHKNRPFALRMLGELQRRHQWNGYLLLAGPPVNQGSSRPHETKLLRQSPRLADAVLEFGGVSESEKAWLFQRARLIVYPTVHEGFGLVPFEAADRGVPCMWAKGTSLSELLPESAAEIIPWDPTESADRAFRLLRDEGARKANLETIRQAAAALSWDEAARQLLDLYEETCDAPATPASGVQRRYGLMQSALSADAMRLVGPGGALPPDLQRPLLALATHPQVGSPMFRAIKFGYRASYRLRRMGGNSRRLLTTSSDWEASGSDRDED